MKFDVEVFSDIELLEKEGITEIEESEIAECLARALKILRKYKGYSLKKVSEGTNIPFPTVARYENGENTPGAVQIVKFAYFYEISLENMLVLGKLENDDCEEFLEKIYN